MASLVLALVTAVPAMAGEARVTALGSRVTLQYTAVPGETNNVTVTRNQSSYTVNDAAATITAPVGGGCTVSPSGHQATCNDPSPLGAIQAIRVDLLDLDDIAFVDAAIPSELLGRGGADELTGGAAFDSINGGVGPDIDTLNSRGPNNDYVQCDAPDTVLFDPDDTIDGDCTNRDVSPTATVTGGPGTTSDTTPTFTFESADTDVTGFECMIDGDDGHYGCESGKPQPELCPNPCAGDPDGPYRLRVRARDAVPGEAGAGPWSAPRAFTVDTHGPQVTVTGPPSGNSSQLTFQLSALDPSPVTFECAIDQADLAPCSSPYTTPPLANGTYVLVVKGTDAAGNSTTTELAFGVAATAGGGGGAPPATVKPSKIIIESLVLISGRPVKMSRNGQVSIRLQCAGTKICKGRMSITTAEPVKRKSRKLERLGTTRFTIAANKSRNVKVRFSKAKRKLAKRLKRFKAKVVINEVDQRGNKRVSSRVFVLRAR